MSAAQPPAGVDTAQVSAMQRAAQQAAGSDRIMGPLAVCGIKSLNIQHNVGPTNLKVLADSVIPKVPGVPPLNPLNIKAKPLKMYDGVPGGGGSGPQVG